MKKVYCTNCDIKRDYVIKLEEQTFTIRKEKVNAVIKACYCKKCGEPVTVDSIFEENMRTFYDAYRKKKGLLTSKEIKAIRKKRNLSQSDVAELIGCGQKTITRYETGYIQDEIFDRFLRLIDDDLSFLIIQQKFGKWENDNSFLLSVLSSYFCVEKTFYECDTNEINKVISSHPGSVNSTPQIYRKEMIYNV